VKSTGENRLLDGIIALAMKKSWPELIFGLILISHSFYEALMSLIAAKNRETGSVENPFG